MNLSRRKAFRQQVESKRAMLVPGAFNALSARIVQDTGFEAVYVTGAGVTNMYYGLPDLGFIGLNELAQHTAQIREAVEIPIIVDADTGFGNALNTYRTVKVLERAGADAIQLEDQVSPKRCGHFSGKEVISVDEMCGKIHAAVDARSDENLLVIARTDTRSVHGFDDALLRAQRFGEAGADVLFIEATESVDELRQLAKLLSKPQLVNIVIGGKTPVVGREELAQLGYGIVLYANSTLQGAIVGMQNALGTLKTSGCLNEDPSIVAPFAERQRLVNKAYCDELEQKYRY